MCSPTNIFSLLCLWPVNYQIYVVESLSLRFILSSLVRQRPVLT